MNLLLNAIAHSPPQGLVELRAEQTSSRISISVRDRGAGIPASERDRIFDSFYTTTGTGTGLGLSVVRHLAREHKWQVGTSDAPGGGTIFTIEIPCAS
jgi:signal transduction histidine kinase